MGFYRAGPATSYRLLGDWVAPESEAEEALTFGYYERVARTLERARFDGIFFADSLGITDVYEGSFAAALEASIFSPLDPLMVLPAMARATTHLGLGVTVSTTFIPPYQIARQLGSLDVLSGGRVAWNVVTSVADFEARNFGVDRVPAKAERYDRADDVVRACMALWESWEPGAVVLDRAGGAYADADKVHYSDYAGPYVSTRGPLTVPRSPQGNPVIMQAGSSDRGQDFAAHWAEMVFAANGDKAVGSAYRAGIRERMERIGRDPDACKVLGSVTIVVADTDAEAQEKAERANGFLSRTGVLAAYSAMAGVDLGRDPEDLRGRADSTVAMEGPSAVVAQSATTDAAIERFTEELTTHVVGSPQTVCDHLQDLFESEAFDGFVVSALLNRSSFEDFADHITPELQRRGLLRREYTGRTLRENLRDG